MTTLAPPPSLPVGLHLGPGVADLIGCWIAEIDARRTAETECADYVELAQHRAVTQAASRSLLGGLRALLRTTTHDGPELTIAVDATTGGLFFRYHRSGYHGGLVRHQDAGGPRWHVHT